MTYLLFGVKLQLFRETVDKTQPEFAQKIGMKLKDYQRLESGQNEPRSGVVLQVCDRLKIKFKAEDMTIELTAQERDKVLGRVQR